MKATSARQKPIGPSAASMNGCLRPIGVWNVSLHGPITSGRRQREGPLSANDQPDQRRRVGELVEEPSAGRRGRRQRQREAEGAEPERPDEPALGRSFATP